MKCRRSNQLSHCQVGQSLHCLSIFLSLFSGDMGVVVAYAWVTSFFCYLLMILFMGSQLGCCLTFVGDSKPPCLLPKLWPFATCNLSEVSGTFNGHWMPNNRGQWEHVGSRDLHNWGRSCHQQWLNLPPTKESSSWHSSETPTGG